MPAMRNPATAGSVSCRGQGEQIGQPHAQSLAQLSDIHDGYVYFAALDSSNVITVKPGFKTWLLLGPALGLSKLPDLPPGVGESLKRITGFLLTNR